MTLLRRVLGDALRGRRLLQQRTLREVSGSARVSLGYLSEVERGQKEASSELLASICAALDIRLSDLLREVSDTMRRNERATDVARAGGRPLVAAGPPPARAGDERRLIREPVAGSDGAFDPAQSFEAAHSFETESFDAQPGFETHSAQTQPGPDGAGGAEREPAQLADLADLDGMSLDGADLADLTIRDGLLEVETLFELPDLANRPDGPHDARCQLAGAAA